MASNERAEAYARGLFELAGVDGSVDAADAALEAAVIALRSHAELRDTLADASVPAEGKRAVVAELFAESSAPVAAVVGLMADNGDIGLVEDVARIFTTVAENERGAVVARVTTAVELDDATRTGLVEDLRTFLGTPVVLRENVDPSIVGGIVINVAGKVIDGSVAARLDATRRALSTTSTGGEA
jgi:F-type H+-transporting ATPase subunit delta